MPGLKERAKTLAELASAAEFLLSAGPPALDPQARKDLSAAEGKKSLENWFQCCGAANGPRHALEAAVRALADEKGLKLGELAQPLRAALTGKTASPPIFDMMAVLGREETLARINSMHNMKNML